MTTYSEMRIKHAKRIAVHVIRANKNLFSDERSLVNFILSGGNLKELLKLNHSENLDTLKLKNIAPRVSATSLSFVIGREPDGFIDLFAKALSNTQEAELLKNGLTGYE